MAALFTGVARDAKGGAVLVSEDGGVLYIAGQSEWPDALHGLPVLVLGRAHREHHVPVAVRDASGAWSQGKTSGAPDDVIHDAVWMPAEWTIRHSDGSGNLTVLSMECPADAGPAAPNARWRYDPVTPSQSSSGFYSGGEARSGTASAPDAAHLWRHLIAVMDAHGDHAECREMGTAMFAVKTAKGERSVVVRSCVARDAFEAALGAITSSS